ASLIKQSIEVLCQPDLSCVEIQQGEGVRAAEEPVLSTRPKIRAARPRRISMSPAYELCERGLYVCSFIDRKDFVEEEEDIDKFKDNIA
ncbi:hypothetical protein PMAYCL1PPCAC_03279, partial [Pristionchus mayeri]